MLWQPTRNILQPNQSWRRPQGAPAAAWTIVGAIGAGTTGGSPPVTTSAIDTTGANLLVGALGGNVSTFTISDSKSNTWTLIRLQDKFGGGTFTKMYYCANPIVGAGHTFTLSDSGSNFASIGVLALSGANASPLDQEAGGASHGAITLTSITPTSNNQICVTCASNEDSSARTIDSGYTIDVNLGAVGGNSFGVCIAHLIQTTAAATAPTWSSPSGGTATIASFKPS